MKRSEMPTWKVLTRWKGWSRGTAVFVVKAENEAIARETYLGGEGTAITVKGDVDHEIFEVLLVEEE